MAGCMFSTVHRNRAALQGYRCHHQFLSFSLEQHTVCTGQVAGFDLLRATPYTILEHSHAKGSLNCLTGEWGGADPEDSQGRLPVVAELEALLDVVGDAPWSYGWLPSVHGVRAAACLAAGGLLRAAGKMPQALGWLDRGRASADAALAQQGIDLQVRGSWH